MNNKINELIPFLLYKDCSIVKGKKRSAIYDLTRRTFIFIPNILAEILVKFDGTSIKQVKESFEHKYHNKIQEYFLFLFEKEFIFFVDKDEKHLFLDMPKDWKSASVISNAIIIYEQKSNYNLPNIFEQLQNLGCKHLEFRTYHGLSLETLKTIFKYIDDSNFRSLDLILRYNTDLAYHNILKLISKNQRITSVLVFGSPKEEYHQEANIRFITSEISSQKQKFYKSPKSFNVNINLYSEALNYNPYYNRKITIDELGSIKNSPEFLTNFGNVSRIRLSEVIKQPLFQKYWNISKDKIKVCQDCEFRYMCIDERIPKQKNKNGLWYFDESCNYDPYTAKWIN